MRLLSALGCFMGAGKRQNKSCSAIVMEVAETSSKLAFFSHESTPNMKKIGSQKAVMNSSHYDYILRNNKKSIVIFKTENHDEIEIHAFWRCHGSGNFD